MLQRPVSLPLMSRSPTLTPGNARNCASTVATVTLHLSCNGAGVMEGTRLFAPDYDLCEGRLATKASSPACAAVAADTTIVTTLQDRCRCLTMAQDQVSVPAIHCPKRELTPGRTSQTPPPASKRQGGVSTPSRFLHAFAVVVEKAVGMAPDHNPPALQHSVTSLLLALAPAPSRQQTFPFAWKPKPK